MKLTRVIRKAKILPTLVKVCSCECQQLALDTSGKLRSKGRGTRRGATLNKAPVQLFINQWSYQFNYTEIIGVGLKISVILSEFREQLP